MAHNDNVVPINGQVQLNLSHIPNRAPSTSTANAPANPHVRPSMDHICWACGTNKVIKNEKYCVKCSLSGLDNPWIECTVPGCNNVKRRRVRGENKFTCKEHRGGHTS